MACSLLNNYNINHNVFIKKKMNFNRLSSYLFLFISIRAVSMNLSKFNMNELPYITV